MSDYGAKVTSWYRQREAAAAAGGPPVVFATFAIGDGGGTVPALSDAGTGLVNELYRAAVRSVGLNTTNPYQVDIECDLPFLDASGAPIGGFTVREVAIYDEGGRQVVAGISSFQKTTAAQGQDSAFRFIVSIVVGNTAAVVISTPSGAFATSDDIAAVDANMADLLALITREATIRLQLEHHVRSADERAFQVSRRLRQAGF